MQYLPSIYTILVFTTCICCYSAEDGFGFDTDSPWPSNRGTANVKNRAFGFEKFHNVSRNLARLGNQLLAESDIFIQWNFTAPYPVNRYPIVLAKDSGYIISDFAGGVNKIAKHGALEWRTQLPYNKEQLQVKKFTVGNTHACGINFKSETRCFGQDDGDYLGKRNYNVPYSELFLAGDFLPIHTEVDFEETEILNVFAGNQTTCLVAEGVVDCQVTIEEDIQQPTFVTSTTFTKAAYITFDKSKTIKDVAIDRCKIVVCATFDDGTAYCLGQVNQVPDVSIPNIQQVVADCGRTCTLSEKGSIINCSARNSARKTGSTIISIQEEVLSLHHGDNFCCALTISGSVQCWETPGDWFQTDDIITNQTPIRIDFGVGTIVEIKTYANKLCVLNNKGEVFCSIVNTATQGSVNFVGNTSISLERVPLGKDDTVSTIQVGGTISCATLVRDQTIRCWGPDGSLGTMVNKTNPNDNSNEQLQPVVLGGYGNPILESPALNAQQELVVTVAGGWTCKLDTNSGEIIWQTFLDFQDGSSPTIDKVGNIIVGAGNGSVYKLNRNGELIWRKQFDSGVFESPAVTKEYDIIVTTKNGEIVRLNAATGERMWLYNTNEEMETIPLIFENAVVLNSKNHVYKLDLEDGTVLWKLGDELDHYFVSSLAILGNGNVLAREATSLKIIDWDSGEALTTVNYYSSFESVHKYMVLHGYLDGKGQFIAPKFSFNIITTLFSTASTISLFPLSKFDNFISIPTTGNNILVVDPSSGEVKLCTIQYGTAALLPLARFATLFGLLLYSYFYTRRIRGAMIPIQGKAIIARLNYKNHKIYYDGCGKSARKALSWFTKFLYHLDDPFPKIKNLVQRPKKIKTVRFLNISTLDVETALIDIRTLHQHVETISIKKVLRKKKSESFAMLSWRWDTPVSASVADKPLTSPNIIAGIVEAKQRGFSYIWIDMFCVEQQNNPNLIQDIENSMLLYAKLNVIVQPKVELFPGCLVPVEEYFNRVWTSSEQFYAKTNPKHGIQDLVSFQGTHSNGFELLTAVSYCKANGKEDPPPVPDVEFLHALDFETKDRFIQFLHRLSIVTPGFIQDVWTKDDGFLPIETVIQQRVLKKLIVACKEIQHYSVYVADRKLTAPLVWHDLIATTSPASNCLQNCSYMSKNSDVATANASGCFSFLYSSTDQKYIDRLGIERFDVLSTTGIQLSQLILVCVIRDYFGSDNNHGSVRKTRIPVQTLANMYSRCLCFPNLVPDCQVTVESDRVVALSNIIKSISKLSIDQFRQATSNYFFNQTDSEEDNTLVRAIQFLILHGKSKPMYDYHKLNWSIHMFNRIFSLRNEKNFTTKEKTSRLTIPGIVANMSAFTELCSLIHSKCQDGTLNPKKICVIRNKSKIRMVSPNGVTYYFELQRQGVGYIIVAKRSLLKELTSAMIKSTLNCIRYLIVLSYYILSSILRLIIWLLEIVEGPFILMCGVKKRYTQYFVSRANVPLEHVEIAELSTSTCTFTFMKNVWRYSSFVIFASCIAPYVILTVLLQISSDLVAARVEEVAVFTYVLLPLLMIVVCPLITFIVIQTIRRVLFRNVPRKAKKLKEMNESFALLEDK